MTATLKLLDRARPEILALQPYSSARVEAGSAEIMLNANESPWVPFGQEDADDAGATLNRYPDPQPPALRARLAHLYGVESENVLIGRGSDEAIDLLVRAFCREGHDNVLTSPPTFGMYAVAARTQGADVVEVPLAADFELNVDGVLAAVTANTKLVFVCSPNNPTGALVPLPDVARLAQSLRDRAVVIVDEAYLEFARGAQSAIGLMAEHDNIAVLRTLSKAFGLAGARIGALVAHPQVVALLRRIQAPYPLPSLCIDAAMTALTPEGIEESKSRIGVLLDERERLARTLPGALGVRAVFPSNANFLCVRFDEATTVYRRLLNQGIVVRDVSRYPGLAHCLRITVGSPHENTRLLAALELLEATA